ncbi:MAG: hypothetical protein PHE24_03275 [Patescibacteria group bacterium]|nr:hypothetical protein [Patescibacteria group bacterium]
MQDDLNPNEDDPREEGGSGEDGGEEVDEDVAEIMESQGVDAETAENVRDVMDEYGVDEDEAAELEEAL